MIHLFQNDKHILRIHLVWPNIDLWAKQIDLQYTLSSVQTQLGLISEIISVHTKFRSLTTYK